MWLKRAWQTSISVLYLIFLYDSEALFITPYLNFQHLVITDLLARNKHLLKSLPSTAQMP